MKMKAYLLNINNITEEEIALIKGKYPIRFSKAKEYKCKEDFMRSIGSSLLLNMAFPCMNESEIEYNEHGKPYSINIPKFSISHSGDFSIMIIDDKDIGIDIEQIESKNIKVSKRVFTEKELEYVGDDIDKFHLLWTRKESYLKKIGSGISKGLKSIDVINDLVDNHFFSMKYSEYYISICSFNKIEDVEIVEVN